MFYKARSKESGNMWDVWMFYRAGTYYLYSLCSAEKGRQTFSMARSKDGVHWTEMGPVLEKDKEVTWMGTGSTWRNPVPGGKPPFQINYSSWKEPRQTIFFAQSEDLIHWTKCGPAKEFVQDERWYERNGRWDCIWTIARAGGGLYGYWTATPKKETCGQFGFGESLDGITWKALKPPYVTGVGEGEVGAIEKVGNRYVMLFGTRGRMETLIADTPQGPFRIAAQNRIFLQGMPHTYFARFFQSPAGLLVCHHSITRTGQVYLALLKGTNFDKDGNLRLAWWPGNEALKHKAVSVKQPSARTVDAVAMLDCRLDAAHGFVLEGTLQLPKSLGAPRGLYVEYARNTGMAILFDYSGRAEFGQISAGGEGFKSEKSVDRETRYGSPARFRLAVRGVLVEVYLDDYLVECHSLPARATGRIGLIRGGLCNSIRAVKAWQSTWRRLPQDPEQPHVIREFQATPMLPPVADIGMAKKPRKSLFDRPLDFMSELELGDVRGIHGGEDGLIYIEASAKLKQSAKGSLSYGSDGPVKVWVNGRVVDSQPKAANPGGVGKYVVKVAWRKGENRITFALSTNKGRAWGVQARVLKSRS